MNKQELIEKLKRHLTVMSEVEGSEYDKGYKHATKQHLVMITELDEPEKPVVPQFIADWLEVCKENLGFGLSSAMNHYTSAMNKQQNNVKDWFKSVKNQETFAKAWHDGYEIEKEKLYTVEIPNPNEPDSGHIVLQKDKNNKVYIDWHYEDDWKLLKSLKLTEAEIKEDFDWAWQFAEEVEE